MEDTKSFKTGDLIFRQGELGHSMFVIKEGSVEVFKNTPTGEVLLTIQGPGEVLGLLTFFQGGQRLASARARTPVLGQLIEQKDGQDPLANLPKWVQIVLKEFSLRLSQINEQFVQLSQEKDALIEQVLDLVQISTQVADCLAELGPFKAKKFEDGRDMLVLDDMLSLLEGCLGYERKILNRIMDIFKNSGLIKLELEPDHGKEIMTLAGAVRLKWYTEFARKARSGANRRLVQTPIPFKFRRTLFALRDLVQKQGGDINKNAVFELNDLVEKFEKICKIPMEPGALELAEKLQLLETKKNGEKHSVSFHPANMTRSLIAVNVIRRLRSDPDADFEQEEEKKAS
jgi:CRP-like cAMP-binding protein